MAIDVLNSISTNDNDTFMGTYIINEFIKYKVIDVLYIERIFFLS